MKVSLSKSQKKIIKKVNKFLDDGLLNKTDVQHNLEQHHSYIQEAPIQSGPNIDLKYITLKNEGGGGEIKDNKGTGDQGITKEKLLEQSNLAGIFIWQCF